MFLASLMFLAFTYFAVLRLSAEKRSWFTTVATGGSLLYGTIFATLGVLKVATERAEVLGYVLTELPFIFILSCVCLAQAGMLPARLRVVGLPEAISNPYFRAVLKSAPSVLMAAWLLSFIAGMFRPVPALEPFESAPPYFLLLKSILMLPEAFYSGIAAWLFFKASGPRARSPQLRLKNLCCSLGVLSWFLLALNAVAKAAARVFLPDSAREHVVAAALDAEGLLLAASAICIGFGLALRFAPTFSESLVGYACSGLLAALDRFEALRWQLVKGGKVRRVIQTTHLVEMTAENLDLAENDLQKSVNTLQLVAIFRDRSGGVKELNPRDAWELHRLQKQFVETQGPASRVRWNKDWDATVSTRDETLDNLPLCQAIEAALELTDDNYPRTSKALRELPDWYQLAATAAADAGFIDEEELTERIGGSVVRQSVQGAYSDVKNRVRL